MKQRRQTTKNMITKRYKSFVKMLNIQIFVMMAIICLAQSSTLLKSTTSDDLLAEFYPEKSSGDGPEARETFNPHVDYNEWTPVGRGDPLKNDPTYDYSPPVLNRVRYWASSNVDDSNQSEQDVVKSVLSSIKEKNENKNEILLLGVPSKRQSYRKDSKYQSSVQSPQYYQQKQKQTQVQSSVQNNIRRNYYVVHHNLPTRLMPPPMQTITPMSTASINGKSSTTVSSQNLHNHYRNDNAGNSYLLTNTNVNGGADNTGGVERWNLSNNQNPPWNYKQNSFYDVRSDESINYVSLTRPDLGASSAIPTAASANLIQKQGKLSVQSENFKRKPWIHELLEKEITQFPSSKPLVSTSSNSVSNLPTKIIHHETHHYYHHTPAPIVIAKPTSVAYTSNPTTLAYRLPDLTSPTNNNHITTKKYRSSPIPMHFQPTKIPQEITTDSMFSHYKQPLKPIPGPMYLIIEGHSKVKTYGLKDNRTKSNQPKIRPISVKDEESIIKHVVLKDDNGKAMEVKHLHEKPKMQFPDIVNKKLIKNNSLEENLNVQFITERAMYSKLENSTRNHTEISMKSKTGNSSDSDMIFVTTISSIPLKEKRQIFDYDQLTESSIFNLFEAAAADYIDDEMDFKSFKSVPNSKYLMDSIKLNDDNDEDSDEFLQIHRSINKTTKT